MTATPLQAAAEGLNSFFASITGARSRRDAPEQPAEPRRDPPLRAVKAQAVPIDRAKRPKAAPSPRRGRLQAEELADSYILSLRPGDYLFRTLKTEFDEFCEEAEIAPVSNKRFAAWLKAHGGRRYREGNNKVTMYEIAPRRRERGRRTTGVPMKAAA